MDQLQDRFFFATARNLPDYILTQPQYDGGLEAQVTFIAEGEPKGAAWVAKQWNPPLRARFQALVAAIAARFDGRIAGFNFDETAIDLGDDTSQFGCDGYFAAELENARFARAAFGAVRWYNTSISGPASGATHAAIFRASSPPRRRTASAWAGPTLFRGNRSR